MQSIVRSVQWLSTKRELRVHIDVRGGTYVQHPLALRIVVSKEEYVGGCVMWDNPNTGAYMDHDMVGHPDTYQTKDLASRESTGFTGTQDTKNRHVKGYLTFRVDDLPTGKYSIDCPNSQGTYKPVELFYIHGRDTDRELDAFFGREEKEKLQTSYVPKGEKS